MKFQQSLLVSSDWWLVREYFLVYLFLSQMCCGRFVNVDQIEAPSSSSSNLNPAFETQVALATDSGSIFIMTNFQVIDHNLLGSFSLPIFCSSAGHCFMLINNQGSHSQSSHLRSFVRIAPWKIPGMLKYFCHCPNCGQRFSTFILEKDEEVDNESPSCVLANQQALVHNCPVSPPIAIVSSSL